MPPRHSANKIRNEAWNRAECAQQYIETLELLRDGGDAHDYAGFYALYWRDRAAVETLSWAMGEDWALPDLDTSTLFMPSVV